MLSKTDIQCLYAACAAAYRSAPPRAALQAFLRKLRATHQKPPLFPARRVCETHVRPPTAERRLKPTFGISSPGEARPDLNQQLNGSSAPTAWHRGGTPRISRLGNVKHKPPSAATETAS